MKVLHVIPSVSPLRGGPSVMLRTMARGLVQAGVTVDVATTDDNGPGRLDVVSCKAVIEDGVTYRYFPRQTKFYTFSWPLTRWLAEHVKDYDVIHIHALFSYAAVPAALLAKRFKVPYIVRPLGVLNRWGMQNRRVWLKKLSFRLIDSRILAGAAAIHYTSEQEMLEAVELGVKQNYAIIPNAVDIPEYVMSMPQGQFRTVHPELTGRFLILFLSRLDPKKGLDILLPAFDRLRKRYPEAYLIVAGNGESEFIAQQKRLAEKLGIGAHILWTGFLNNEQKWFVLRDADVFVLPSYSENFGIAVVEAMAIGLPVIVSNRVAIHREVANANAGLVVGCTIDQLSEALSRIIALHGTDKTLGRNGLDTVHKKFRTTEVIRELTSLYNKFCKVRVTSERPICWGKVI